MEYASSWGLLYKVYPLEIDERVDISIINPVFCSVNDAAERICKTRERERENAT